MSLREGKLLYDPASLDAFTVAMVLDAFGVKHGKSRGPCPLCKTSQNSEALAFRGPVYKCFACGRQGNQVGLYAEIAGVSRRDAVNQIAARLGLTGSDPKTISAAIAKRVYEADRRASRERRRNARLNWLTKMAYAAERKATRHRRLAAGCGQGAAALEHIWKALALEEHAARWDRKIEEVRG